MEAQSTDYQILKRKAVNYDIFLGFFLVTALPSLILTALFVWLC